ncbi:hypothetical protein [Clostridium rectalis]|nr:hypothetical protein [Clostridium rectalis]
MKNIKGFWNKITKDNLENDINIKKYIMDFGKTKETIELLMMLNNSFIIK